MVERSAEAGGTSSFDEVSAERLLRGQHAPAGASAGEQALGRLLAAAAAPPSTDELSGEAWAVAAFVATRPATTGPRHAWRVRRQRRSVLTPRISHGVAAAAALGVLTVGGVAAAAYTGSLPSSMQRLAHDHLGAPGNHHAAPPHHHRTAAGVPPHATAPPLRSPYPSEGEERPGLSAVASSPPSSVLPRRSPSTPPARSTDRYRLCMTYTVAAKQQDAQAVARAYRALIKAAGGPQQVAEYCAPVWPPSQSITPNPDPEPRDPVRPSGPPIKIGPQPPDQRSPG